MINLNDVLCEDDRYSTDEEIASLAVSIGNHGLLQQILLQELPPGKMKKYRVTDGRRRYRALLLLKRYEIDDSDVKIKNYDDPELIAFIANHERKNLSIREEIEKMAELREKYSPSELCTLLGHSDKYVRTRLSLTHLTPFFLDNLERETLLGWKYAHYLAVAKFSHAVQEILRKNLRSYMPSTLAELERYLDKNFSALLEHAPFDTEACKGCSERSDADSLFPELETDQRVRCLNQSCFAKKQAFTIKEKISHIKTEKKAIVPVALDPSAPKPARVKALDADQVDVLEIDVPEEKANALIVNGAAAGKYCRIADKHSGGAAPLPAAKTPAEERELFMKTRLRLASLKYADYLGTHSVPIPSDDVLIILSALCPIKPGTFDESVKLPNFDCLSPDRMREELWQYYLRCFRNHAANASRRNLDALETAYDRVSAQICGLNFEDFVAEAEK